MLPEEDPATANGTKNSSNRFTAFAGTTRVSQCLKKQSPTHTYPDHQSSFIFFLHLLRSQHTPCSIYVINSLFCTTSQQVLLVYLLVWNPPLHTPSTSYSIYFFTQSLSSFRTHAHTITTCFAEVPILCHLILISLFQLFTLNSIFYLNAKILLTILIHARRSATSLRATAYML